MSSISAPSTAQEALLEWQSQSEILPVLKEQNAVYDYDEKKQKLINAARPWSKDPHYFTQCRISALALVKMTTHARSGGNLEVMGLMTGYVAERTIVVTDAFRLPVEGTETRVNAQDEADEYMVNYLTRSREGGGRAENAVGWYHSHPGYGCWLSGIDVSTQMNQQTYADPFVAVVIDPNMTVSAGKVEIGAFRTFPKDYGGKSSGDDGSKKGSNSNKISTGASVSANSRSGLLGDNVAIDNDGFQTIPAAKMEDFGAHANSYYSLQVSHFKSTLDGQLLSLLWNKYWVSTLSQSPLYTSGDYLDSQISEHAANIRKATVRQQQQQQQQPRQQQQQQRQESAFQTWMAKYSSVTSGQSLAAAAAAAAAAAEGGPKETSELPKPADPLAGLPGLESDPDPDLASVPMMPPSSDVQIEQLVRAGRRIAQEEGAGLTAARIKEKLFLGIFEEASNK